MTKPVDGAEALVKQIAHLIDAELLRQDGHECHPGTLNDDLVADYVDQHHVDMGAIARAVLALPDLRLAGVKEGLEMAAKVAEDFEGTAALERCDDPLSAAGCAIGEAIRAIPVKADH